MHLFDHPQVQEAKDAEKDESEVPVHPEDNKKFILLLVLAIVTVFTKSYAVCRYRN